MNRTYVHEYKHLFFKRSETHFWFRYGLIILLKPQNQISNILLSISFYIQIPKWLDSMGFRQKPQIIHIQ